MVSQVAQGGQWHRGMACLTPPHLARDRDAHWTQGYECLQFVSIFSAAWKGHRLSPPCQSVPPPLASTTYSRMISILTYFHPNSPYCFHLFPHHTFLDHRALSAFSPSSLNSSWTCCLSHEVCTPCLCCRDPDHRDYVCISSPQLTENGSWKAGIMWTLSPGPPQLLACHLP